MSLFFLLSLLACKRDKVDEETGASADEIVLSDCDPVAPTLCGLPFPSTFYMREDTSSATGWRVHLGATTLPKNANHYQPVPDYWNERDGWSPLTMMMAHLPGVSLEGVIGHDDLGAYLNQDAKTVVVDVATGERVPHFVELDMTHDDDDRRLLLIRPVTPMQYGHRYVVGLRGLVDESGAAITPSEAFQALRDDASSDDPDVEGRRGIYDEVVFPTLEGQGWSRGEVQLAWDFVVGSKEGITGRMRWLRDDALDQLADGPSYTIDEVVEFTAEENANTARRVYGTMKVPLYTVEDHTNTVLTRDQDGMPYQNGETEVPFTVIVPRSLVEAPRPGAIVQYGHGLLGGQGEVEGGYLAELSNRYGWVLIAVDWTGMKSEDALAITAMIAGGASAGDEAPAGLDRFAIVPERTMQGFVEALAAMRLISGPLAQDAALMVEDLSSGELVSLVDTEKRYYYGNSQGGIFGGAYMALSTDVERGVLGVAGMPYSLLLDRSHDFDTFFALFRAMYPDPAETMFWLGAIQTLWDQGEPSGYGLTVTGDPLEGTSPKTVLLQVAIGDNQVTTLGAHVMARAYGATLLDPPVREVWGLETVSGETTGSALVEWDYGLSEPTENLPPDGEDPHEWPRREELAQEQMYRFFEEGIIVNTCDGPCAE